MPDLARPYFDRRRFDGFSREEIIDAYVGAYEDRERLLSELQRLEAVLESKQEPW